MSKWQETPRTIAFKNTFPYFSVFRHAQSVGKHVPRPLVLSPSGVLTVLRVGSWGLHGTIPSLSFKEEYTHTYAHTCICFLIQVFNKIKTFNKTHLGYPHPPPTTYLYADRSLGVLQRLTHTPKQGKRASTFRSKVKVTQRPRIYTTCCLMVIHPSAKFGMPHMSKSKDNVSRTQIQNIN